MVGAEDSTAKTRAKGTLPVYTVDDGGWTTVHTVGMVRSGLVSNHPDSDPTISGFKSQLHDIDL